MSGAKLPNPPPPKHTGYGNYKRADYFETECARLKIELEEEQRLLALALRDRDRWAAEYAQAAARVKELAAKKPAAMRQTLCDIEMETREGGQWTIREINEAAKHALGES